MLFSWNGNYGIPVSIVWDAAGFLNGTAGAVPASDGTYSSAPYGYLNLGPVPIATTTWNLNNFSGCGLAGNNTTTTGGGCLGVNPSGGLPLVTDTRLNINKSYYTNTYGIGGVPMWDGPFVNFNFNFDFTALTQTGTRAGTIGPFPVNTVPVPAAVWLFGSGLLGLIGVAKRRTFQG